MRLPDGALRVGLGAVLTASGVRLLEVPGYEILVPVILVLGGAAAVLAEVKRHKAPAAPY